MKILSSGNILVVAFFWSAFSVVVKIRQTNKVDLDMVIILFLLTISFIFYSKESSLKEDSGK